MRFSLAPALAALALVFVSSAHATPITGTVSISGNDTFDSNHISFNPSTGTVYQASGTMSSFAPIMLLPGLSISYMADLTGFSFANAAGTSIFSVENIAGHDLSFTISDLLTKVLGTDSNGPTLSLSGTGFFTETGYDQTYGTFSLTSSSAGITGFQLVSNTTSPAAVTPEPSSFALLGSGLLGVAGIMKRRFA